MPCLAAAALQENPLAFACTVSPKGFGDLSKVVFWIVLFMQPDLGVSQLPRTVVERPKQSIPHHQKLTKVDLGIFELTLVMPAMNFSNPDDVTQPSQPVVQVRMLEGQVHGQDAKPGGDHG